MYSVVIPVFGNEASLPELLERLEKVSADLDSPLEAVFVVDGSPDKSHEFLRQALREVSFCSQLLLLSRNFGSFPAIRTGLRYAKGSHFAVLSADLQEPPELIPELFRTLTSEPCDLVFGKREGRADPFFSRLSAQTFWSAYRALVQPEMPVGGVDVIACNGNVRRHLLEMESIRTSLVGQLVWLGFRTREVAYTRAERMHGKSQWTWSKKMAYFQDSFFSFTDAPIRILLTLGVLGTALSLVLGLVILTAKLTGGISVPGYTATVLIVLFFAGINLLSLGIIGSYAHRAYENTKGRPAAVVMLHEQWGEEAGH